MSQSVVFGHKRTFNPSLKPFKAIIFWIQSAAHTRLVSYNNIPILALIEPAITQNILIHPILISQIIEYVPFTHLLKKQTKFLIITNPVVLVKTFCLLILRHLERDKRPRGILHVCEITLTLRYSQIARLSLDVHILIADIVS